MREKEGEMYGVLHMRDRQMKKPTAMTEGSGEKKNVRVKET